jgi:PAS domain S-box-containing protein
MRSDLVNRILLLTPTGRDAALIAGFLAREGLSSLACRDARDLVSHIVEGAGAVIVAEEALTEAALSIVVPCLAAQPPWSDLPLIVLSTAGESTPIVEHRYAGIAALGNVTVIERPVRPTTLLTSVRAALRARRRQYEVDELLHDLHHAEERLRSIIESAHDYAIINLDLEGRVTYWNAGAERLLAYPEHEIVGSPIDRTFPDPAEAQREFATARSAGRAESEGWRVRRDGSRFWSSGVITPTRGRSGEITGFVQVLRDITERRRQEERLAEQTRLLQQSNEDLERFAYAVSHDLQEPLRMVGSYSQLLVRRNEGRLDEDSQQFVRYIVTGVERMRALVRDLLEFSKATKEHPRPEEPVDANAVLGLVLQNLQFRISEAGARITFDRLPLVWTHESRLLQVLQNLIGNALKYCETKPEIHISADLDGEDCWRIGVHDNGIGIPPQHREKVFGLFTRLHTRAEYPGTGIGLATCKRIVEQEGGRIWVESTPGKGSTFYFTLPRA